MVAENAKLEETNPDLASKPTQNDIAKTTSTTKPKPKRPPKPNYAKIHSRPLPLEVFPLPAFIPQNPLSLLRIAYAILKDIIQRPSSFPARRCVGSCSAESRSVHVTDPVHVRALWEMGFFGKGTLSRSEPSWLERERAKRAAGPGGTSEEATSKRREERRLFKLERARAERELVEQQLQQERQMLSKPESVASSSETLLEPDDAESGLEHVFPWMKSEATEDNSTSGEPKLVPKPLEAALKLVKYLDVADGHAPETSIDRAESHDISLLANKLDIEDEVDRVLDLNINQEHLQLMPEEAFFLSYGLGVLDVYQTDAPIDRSKPLSNTHLFNNFQKQAVFPASTNIDDLRPDNSFLLHYAVYHHYRSLGWVVRPGSKFSADFLLYNRGPVFSHAEFAVMIIPEYSKNVQRAEKNKDWWWLHSVNRVQSQVRKTLVLCYIEIPVSYTHLTLPTKRIV